MPSKPLRPWSKPQPGPETSPRTGGILPTLKHRASRLVLLPFEAKQNASSPVTTHYDTALANAVGNLHIAVNDMLSSRSSSVHGPPRSRPRSTSVPLVVESPAGLSDSALLKERGQFWVSAPVLTTPSVEATHNESQQPIIQSDYEKAAMNAPHPGAPKLVYAKSKLARGSSYSVRKKNHANDAPIANDTPQFETPKTKRNSSSTAASMLRRRLGSDAMKSLAVVMRNDFVKSGSEATNQEAEMPKNFEEATILEPSPIAHSKHAQELESNDTLQNHAISTLKSQFDNSRETCESHVNALKCWHSVQVASFETQTRSYKERTNKQNFQVTASSGWLAGIHSEGSSHTHAHENVEKPADLDLADVNTPPRRESAGQQLSQQQPPNNPQTQNLERKPLGTPGLESTTHCLLSESSLYEQDRAALQKQIDLITAKLSISNKNEQELRSVLAMTKRENADKAMNANKLAEKIQALHNTVAHLENRLEVANMKRVDAEEQLLAWKDQKSPFDLISPQQPVSAATNQAALNIQTNTGTGTDTNSPNQVAYTSGVVCLEEIAPAALVRMEELQTQAKKKDAFIAGLETQLEQLQETHSQLQHEHKRVAVQLDLQHELLRETRATDRVIEQLRTAVINHESTIMENEQTIHALRRQLEHHKLLLQAEIRRHAAMKLYVAAEEHPLPELMSLAKREDIDCWMEKLHKRLRREQLKNKNKAFANTPEAKIESLRHEINFYISEIILFKLDIKGYKSDVRKLKEMIAHQGNSQKLADIEPRPSSSKTVASPVESSFAPITPELDAFLGAPSVMGHTDTVSGSEVFSITPSSSVRLLERRTGRESDQLLELEVTQNFRTSRCIHSSTSKAGRVDSALSPSSNALQVSERLTTSCSLNHSSKRSMSAPPLRLCQRPVTLGRPATGEGAQHRARNERQRLTEDV